MHHFCFTKNPQIQEKKVNELSQYCFAGENRTFKLILSKKHLTNLFVQFHVWTTIGTSVVLCLLLQLHNLLPHFLSFLSHHQFIDQLFHFLSLHIGIIFNPNVPFIAYISTICWLLTKKSQGNIGTPAQMLSIVEFHPQWVKNLPIEGWFSNCSCGHQLAIRPLSEVSLTNLVDRIPRHQ